MYQKTAFQRGFTLVEVSIVLAVLGLLVGTVVGAQALSKSQKLKEIVSSATGYLLAAKQFKAHYGYLPGDFPTATEVWGRLDGGDVTVNCSTATESVAAPSIETCNGNGDGYIYRFLALGGFEYYRAWQHLTNAGLVKGKYSGANTGLRPRSYAGINVPAGPFNKTGFSFASATSSVDGNGPRIGTIINNSNASYFDGNYDNTILYGTDASAAFGYTNDPAIEAAEAYILDSKFDDGTPAKGVIRNYKQGFSLTPNCVLGTDSSAQYNIGYTGTACAMIFMPIP